MRTTIITYKTNSTKARLLPLRMRIADRLIWQVGEDLPVVVATPASCKASERKKKKNTAHTANPVGRPITVELSCVLLGLLLNQQPCKSHRKGV